MRTAAPKSRKRRHRNGTGATAPTSYTLTASSTAGGKITGPGINTAGLPWRGGGIPSHGEDLATVDYEWYYNWSFGSALTTNVPFVPMAYNAAAMAGGIPGAVNTTNYDYLLGFNEPDSTGMTVAHALDLWPQLVATGLKLGSPAVTTGAATWRNNFINGLATRGLPELDFICVHWYQPGGAVADLVNYLTNVYNNHTKADNSHYPIWLTEFDNFGGTLAENTTFIRNAGPALGNLPWLHRVGWFANRSIAGPYYANVGLCDSSGTLTSVGTAYKAWPTSHGDNTQTYPAGTVVPVSATSDTGYTFTTWGGALTGVQPSKTVTMNANHSISATFTAATQSSDRWYSDSSPFNKKNGLGGIVRAGTGTDIAYNGDPASSAQIVSRMIAQGTFTKEHFGDARTSADFSHPFYFADANDPTFTLRQGLNGQWVNPDVEGDALHIPAYALPAGGSDHSMAIVQPSGVEYNLWDAQAPASGAVHCGFAKKVSHVGTGLQEGAQGGITAAGFANGLGVIRLDELKAGLIDHALFFAVNGWHYRCWPGQGTAGHSGETSVTTAPPMGCLFRLNMTASAINALARPAWQKAINLAQAEYGMYVGDQSGSVIALQTESDVPWRAQGVPEKGVAWAQSVGLPSFNQTRFDVDLNANVTRTIYTMDWTIGVDWASKLQALKPPSSA